MDMKARSSIHAAGPGSATRSGSPPCRRSRGRRSCAELSRSLLVVGRVVPQRQADGSARLVQSPHASLEVHDRLVDLSADPGRPAPRVLGTDLAIRPRLSSSTTLERNRRSRRSSACRTATAVRGRMRIPACCRRSVGDPLGVGAQQRFDGVAGALGHHRLYGRVRDAEARRAGGPDQTGVLADAFVWWTGYASSADGFDDEQAESEDRR